MSNKQNLSRPIERKIRFNKAENDYISDKIKASPFNNFQNFARVLLIMGEVKFNDYKELLNLIGSVNRIGVDINQMAKLAFYTDMVDLPMIEKMTEDVFELKLLVNERLQEVFNKEDEGKNGSPRQVKVEKISWGDSLQVQLMKLRYDNDFKKWYMDYKQSKKFYDFYWDYVSLKEVEKYLDGNNSKEKKIKE